MDRVLKESYLLNPRPSRRKQSGKGWKNGHMVTAVTVTAIQTFGEALYDSKECLL